MTISSFMFLVYFDIIFWCLCYWNYCEYFCYLFSCVCRHNLPQTYIFLLLTSFGMIWGVCRDIIKMNIQLPQERFHSHVLFCSQAWTYKIRSAWSSIYKIIQNLKYLRTILFLIDEVLFSPLFRNEWIFTEWVLVSAIKGQKFKMELVRN